MFLKEVDTISRTATLVKIVSVPTTYVFMENWRKLFQDFHQMLFLNRSSAFINKTDTKEESVDFG